MIREVALFVLGFERQSEIIAALVGLGVAGLVVSAGAWVLLARERRRASAQDPSDRS